jgi:rubrerythrin
MPPVTWEQALRNAIAAERGAAHFYDRLRQRTRDGTARAFLARMVAVELAHAAKVEQLAADGGAELPAQSDSFAAKVETAPGWDWVEDMDLGEALAAALESENSAYLFYDALADVLTGEAKSIFVELANEEREHAELVREQIKRLESQSRAR